MMSRCVALLAICSALLAGCSTDPVNETHNGALEESDPKHEADQSYYDEYTFKADEGWQITITMNTPDTTVLDPYLQLRREGVEDAQFLEEADDVAPGSDLNAQLSLVAPASGTYKVWANSAMSGQTGPYTLTISAQPAQ